MKIDAQMTDEGLLKLLGSRLAELRLSRNLTQKAVAEEAGVGLRTVQRLELGMAATQLSGFLRVCRVLGLVERFELLVPEVPPSPMARLKLEGRQRKRASGQRVATRESKPWTWGDGA
jgi:transcriptional regulator with XRE-family HTH domain